MVQMLATSQKSVSVPGHSLGVEKEEGKYRTESGASQGGRRREKGEVRVVAAWSKPAGEKIFGFHPITIPRAATMGALEHTFTKDQLDLIVELRERERLSWSVITRTFNQTCSLNLSIDEIRWAYSNLC
ncbi:MAG: hypothetical protein M1825_000155 [Sarcosagium campestre]|nr:MAG: hypothetical protein M1825_000155 [Sarcosagium campestre]